MEDFFFFCPIGDKHWGEDGWRVFVCDTEEEPAMCEYMWRLRVCVEGMADVLVCFSVGCDSGARPAYVSSDGTYGRSL